MDLAAANIRAEGRRGLVFQSVMRAVAKWGLAGAFTRAEKELACLWRFPAFGRKFSVFVRAIAEGLAR